MLMKLNVLFSESDKIIAKDIIINAEHIISIVPRDVINNPQTTGIILNISNGSKYIVNCTIDDFWKAYEKLLTLEN